ncbi:MAG: hypothetical protein EA401_04410 [Planctomycetota bacterium]|nr:MAG: hypothetical protein EA401_04410 [Planctomycetota bacterium]
MPDDHDHSDIERESWDLASAFAQGELDEAGQQRLYQLLRGRDQHARITARNTWQALAMRTDLRSALGSETFIQATNLRIDEGRQGDGFVQSVLHRLGFSRPRLRPVAPAAQAAPSRRWLGLLMVAGVLAAMVLVLAVVSPLTRSQSLSVVSSSGIIRHDGELLGHRRSLSPGVLTVAAGSEIHLAGDQDSHWWITGPAQASVSGRGLGLVSGRVRIHAGAAERSLGGPDGQLRLRPHSQALVEIHHGQVLAGMLAGEARWILGEDTRVSIASDQALFAGQVFPWQAGDALTAQRWILPVSQDMAFWQAHTLWLPGESGSLHLHDAEGEILLSISNGVLVSRGQQWALPGPPRQERRFTLSRAGNRYQLAITGWQQTLNISHGTPHHWQALNDSSLQNNQWWSGPRQP